MPLWPRPDLDASPGTRRSEPEAELPPFQGPVQGREYSRNKATARCYPALLPSSIFLLLPDPGMGTGLGRGEQGEAATLGAGNRGGLLLLALPRAPPSPGLGPGGHGNGQDSGLTPKGMGVLEEGPAWPGVRMVRCGLDCMRASVGRWLREWSSLGSRAWDSRCGPGPAASARPRYPLEVQEQLRLLSRPRF